jgi:hypothetical protein
MDLRKRPITPAGALERTVRARAGKLTLSLKASRWAQTFTDRQQRTAGVKRTSKFIRRWGQRGFRADPPNAALSIDRPGGDVMPFELKRPRVARGWLHYSVKPLKGAPRGARRVKLGPSEPLRCSSTTLPSFVLRIHEGRGVVRSERRGEVDDPYLRDAAGPTRSTSTSR